MTACHAVVDGIVGLEVVEGAAPRHVFALLDHARRRVVGYGEGENAHGRAGARGLLEPLAALERGAKSATELDRAA